jgi:hypothetical protein
VAASPLLEQVKGDIRDRALIKRAMTGCEVVIHVACISNDPSFELNPELGKSINYDAFFDLVAAAKDRGSGASFTACNIDPSRYQHVRSTVFPIDDLFVFEPPGRAPYPTYRFLRDARHPNWLITNSFGLARAGSP